MDTREILNFCIEKGLLLDREVLNLFEESVDSESAKLIIEKIREQTRTKVITKTVFNENREKVRQFFSNLPEEKQQKFRKLKIRLGLNIEISKEIGNSEEPSVEEKEEIQKQKSEGYNLKINSFPGILPKKPDANDFTNHFKSRLIEMSSFLQAHSELTDLVSINKISGSRQGISIIGIVADKRVTKNKNIIIDVEDLTGRIKVLINHNRKEVYEKAEDIALDSVIGIKCSGSREIVFVNDIVFPDSVLPERKNSPIEEYALFISDVHIGSKLFLEKNFLKFIDYLNGKIPNTPEVSKIKYLFIVGDLVAGVGIYPNQERDLVLSNLEEQFARAAELLGQIRKDIAIIISPGNHDGIRLAEPQPTLDEKYAWPLFNLENVFMTGNPCEVNLGAVPGFGGFNVLPYTYDFSNSFGITGLTATTDFSLFFNNIGYSITADDYYRSLSSSIASFPQGAENAVFISSYIIILLIFLGYYNLLRSSGLPCPYHAYISSRRGISWRSFRFTNMASST